MSAKFWDEYRKTTGELTWRLATTEDQPAIDRIRETSERLLNEAQKNPDLFAVPIMLVLVAENPIGEIVDALYVEAQVEVVKIGCATESFIETLDLQSDIHAWLRGLGIKTAIVRTRLSLKEKMRYVLSFLGFECQDDEFSYWKRDL